MEGEEGESDRQGWEWEEWGCRFSFGVIKMLSHRVMVEWCVAFAQLCATFTTAELGEFLVCESPR